MCLFELPTVSGAAVEAGGDRLSTTDDYAFDNSGNTTGDAEGRTFVYDAENKQVEVKNSGDQTIGKYRYDSEISLGIARHPCYYAYDDRVVRR